MPRNITRITAPSTRPARRVDIVATLAVLAGAPVVPVAVASLVATAGTARTILTWPAITGAVSYDVESSAASAGPFTSLSTAGVVSFADLTASVSAITYYRVRARNAVGAGPYSPVASATATAGVGATTASTSLIPVPTNLQRQKLWVSAANAGTNVLTWNGVPRAISYNLYLGDYPVGSVVGVGGAAPATTFQVPTSLHYAGFLYTVTAVTAQGESIQSTLCSAAMAWPPGNPPYWANTTLAPGNIKFILAEPEWNAGQPRILVRWGGGGAGSPFNVYRNGLLVAVGLTACIYVDGAVVAGQTYSYNVSSTNEYAPSLLEGPQGTPSVATALSAQPALSSTPIPITRTVSHDDSVFVYFNHVAGAKDYICYKDNSSVAPEVAMKNGKAAGEWRETPNPYVGLVPERDEMCIQMNDLDTVNPTTLRVAALDKLARFQKMDGMMTAGMASITGGPSTPNMNNDGIAQLNGPPPVDGFIKNGQGDPSNAPNVVALSAPFSVLPTPFAFAGTDGHGGQPFLDRFKTGINEPIVAGPVESSIALYASDAPGLLINNPKVQRFLTPNWSFTNYTVDNANTKIFFMPHLMTTLYDGGGPSGVFALGRATAANYGLHIANASLTLQPRENDPTSPNFGANKYFSIAGGKTLHVTMEVDAHTNTRRFLLMLLKGRGQALYNAAPTKMHDENMTPGNRATADANLFALIISGSYNGVTVFQANGSTTSRPYDRVDIMQAVDYSDGNTTARAYPNDLRLQGTTRELDKMHRFHIYVSHTQFRIIEEGPDAAFSIVYERPFPAGYVLPWDEIEPVFVHELYHTGIDSLDGEEYSYSGTPGGPDNRHWVVNTPYRDERHWDNMGARVLDAFPVEPLGMQVDHASVPAGTTVTLNVTLPLGNITAGSFSLRGTTGSTMTSTVFPDSTHATVTIHAGTAGPMTLLYESPTISRALLLPVV